MTTKRRTKKEWTPTWSKRFMDSWTCNDCGQGAEAHTCEGFCNSLIDEGFQQ